MFRCGGLILKSAESGLKAGASAMRTLGNGQSVINLNFSIAVTATEDSAFPRNLSCFCTHVFLPSINALITPAEQLCSESGGD